MGAPNDSFGHTNLSAVAVLHLRLAMERPTKTRKSHRSEPSGRNGRSEYATFESALRKVVSVPHSEIQAKLDAEKKRKTSSRAASAKV
jgi:hypothetical protein